MNSNHIVNRRFVAALVAALLVLIPALGCGSDDDDSATTAAATGTDTGNGVDSLQEAQTQLCSRLSDVEADLTEVSTSGTEAGQDVLAGLASFAAALTASAETLTTAGAADAATTAKNLASDLESLSTSGGEDAQARAGDAADEAQQLSDELRCP